MARRKKEDSQLENRKEKVKNFISTHGRRKTATATVRLFSKPGQTLVNTKPVEDYFPGSIAKIAYQKPFVLTDTLNKVHATIKVDGSGKLGQLGAAIHGISRALISLNPEFRPVLKKEGLLTRDPRAKERRKYGLAQKARKGKQSPRR